MAQCSKEGEGEGSYEAPFSAPPPPPHKGGLELFCQGITEREELLALRPLGSIPTTDQVQELITAWDEVRSKMSPGSMSQQEELIYFQSRVPKELLKRHCVPWFQRPLIITTRSIRCPAAGGGRGAANFGTTNV